MPDLFLSYSKDDRVFMNTLAENLRKLGFNLWIDSERLPPGTPDWEEAIESAIAQVDAMVVVLTPAAKASQWVKAEIRKAQHKGKPVFPVLAAGDDDSAIPLSLSAVQYADMRGRADYEGNFRLLVEGLAAQFGMTVSAFSMDFAGQPRVQINVYGHHEGAIVAVGGDVSGEMYVAGRDMDIKVAPQREEASAVSPPALNAEAHRHKPVLVTHLPSSRPAKPAKQNFYAGPAPRRTRKWTPIAFVGGLAALGLLIGGIALSGILRGGQPSSSTTEPISATQPVGAARESPLSVTATPTNSPTPAITTETTSPDFGKVAYVCDRAICLADGQTYNEIARFDVGVSTEAFPTWLSWSPDQTRIAFGIVLGDSDQWYKNELYTLDVISGKTQRLTNNNADDKFPKWSPDGNQIAFLSTSENIALISGYPYVMDASGANVERLDSIDTNGIWWLPSGRILYTPLFDDRGMFVTNPDGSGKALLLSQNPSVPAISPNGRYIAYYANIDCPSDRGDCVFLYDLQTGQDRQFLPDEPEVGTWHWFYWTNQWSPDGKLIAVQAIDDSRQYSVFVVDSNGIEFRHIEPLPSSGDLLVGWSPDGNWIVTSDSSDRSVVYIVHPDGSGRRLIAHWREPAWPDLAMP